MHIKVRQTSRCNFSRNGLSRLLRLLVEQDRVLVAVTLQFLELRLAIASTRPTVEASTAGVPQAHDVHILVGLVPFDFYLVRRLERYDQLPGLVARSLSASCLMTCYEAALAGAAALERTKYDGTKRPNRPPERMAIIKRRANAIGLPEQICNHTFRATGITAYLENGGTIKHALAIANHESPKPPSSMTAPVTR